jgi:hypothetical protein
VQLSLHHYNDLLGSPRLTHVEIDLDAEARRTFLPTEINPLVDSLFCAEWIDLLRRQRIVSYTHGGYLEDRRFLWRGSYLSPQASVHLGVDVNVAAGTPIFCPVPFSVEHRWHDPDQQGGWGGRMIVGIGQAYLIFAHLELNAMLDKGRTYPAGTRIGNVAKSDRNGNWFPHLHLQGLRDLKRLDKIDGYGPANAANSVVYPHPAKVLGLGLVQ